MAEDRYVVGIDFGTTYSGVAWCWSGQPDNIQLVTRWKTRLNLAQDNAKAPTEIHYGVNGEIAWGYDVPPDQEAIRWFKLLLVNDSDLDKDIRNSPQLKRAKELLRQLKKTPVDVIADFLRLLWKHATDDIIRDRGSVAFKGSRLRVWITVPAIWQADACKRMRQAVEKAGILEYRSAGETTVDLVAEPEAAAMAVLDDFKGRPDVKPGDVFVVCDAGGGTVDIISYSIDSIKPLTVRECVQGKGKMCGAIFIDQEFVELLETTLGDRWKNLSPAGKKATIHNEWEFGIKRSYDDSDKEWSVAVPAEAFQKQRTSISDKFRRDHHRFDSSRGEIPMRSGQLKFARGHIRSFFEYSFQNIRSLIHDQIKSVKDKQNGQTPKSILLVGGLGNCNYLYQELNQEFERKGINVLQSNGPRPWTAICRGAVIRGLSDAEIQSQKRSLILSRVSRHNYGIVYQPKFDEMKHDRQDRIMCPKELCYKAKDQMAWYLKMGDDIFTKQPVELSYYWLFDSSAHFYSSSLELSVCRNDEKTAPYRKTDNVKPLVTISLSLDIGFNDLAVYVNEDGYAFRKLVFTLRMTSTGTEMRWKVLVDGRVQGEKNVRISED